jgi:hypothetical protein
MSYTRESVLRTRHKVTVFESSRARSLKDALANVPDDAQLIEIDETAAGATTLVYLDEKEHTP